MAEVRCPKCYKTIGAAQQAAFCPFCGEPLGKTGSDLAAVYHESDPFKKRELLLTLHKQHPDSLEIAEEILHLGRLYERGKKGADFSMIKCYMLNVYLEPEVLKKNRREELRREIFDHPDLDGCLSLCGDREIFLRRYLERLSEEFIRLFLKGSTRYMHALFGYVSEGKAPKYLALPAANMLSAMWRDETLTEQQRHLLTRAFYTAFARQLDGKTQYLDDLLKQYNLTMDTQ